MILSLFININKIILSCLCGFSMLLRIKSHYLGYSKTISFKEYIIFEKITERWAFVM